MRVLLCLILMATAGCSKRESGAQAADQPPIPEEEFVTLVEGLEHSPLTGRSEEIKTKVRAYLTWHENRGTDPFGDTNAGRLRYLRDYWEAWKDPRRLDDHNALYRMADQSSPGSGDELRAQELQARFIEFHYAVPLDKALKEASDYLWSWEEAHEVSGPYDIDPIRWVLRHRESVLAEGEAFNTKHAAAEGWRARLDVLDAFAKQKAQHAQALNAARNAAKEKQESLKQKAFSAMMDQMEAAERARAASGIMSLRQKYEDRANDARKRSLDAPAPRFR